MINLYYSDSRGSLFFPPEPLNKCLEEIDIPLSNDIFKCPAFKASIANIFVVRAVGDYEFIWHPPSRDNQEGSVSSTWYNEGFLNDCVLPRQMSCGFLSYLNIRPIFFADKSVIAEQLPPYLHNTFFSKQMVMPGKFDIGKHLRPLELSFKLRNTTTPQTIKIRDRDPLFYLKLYTEETVKLNRFMTTPELLQIGRDITFYKNIVQKVRPLNWWYDYTCKNGYTKKYLQIIKQNLLDTE